MSKALRQLRHLAAAVAVFSVGLTAAFYWSGFIYDRMGWRPPPLAALIVNAVLAVLILVTAVNLVGRFFRPSSKDFFASLTEALERIARGDFAIRLDESRARGPFGDLARKVNETAAKLDQLEKMRQEFVSNVSHEIQSPLTSIRGFATALRQEDLGESDRKRYLEIIEAESLRLSRLSANLLKLASLESGQTQLMRRTYRLDRQIRELILSCETQWTDKHLDLDVDLGEAEINADEDLLSQVWINLLHNAIKFTPEGGLVRIALQRQEGGLEVRVADSGIGIASEDQPRIFERFYKADRSRQSATGGSGLGLAIAKRIVDLHRGAISVRSEAGAGAEFLVTLPLV